ncbi:ras guanine nucleotide exchange factor Q [Calliphora vicina]|uniref:ras guanine nucleotide exchange factor Q n=1 Tax=Calliphora vicina TaxID=7373 RepID=UPI00325BB321
MSNDEYKTSLLNYNRYYFGQPTTNNNNNYCSNNSSSIYQTVFPAKRSDKNSQTTPSSQKPTYQTDDVNDNNNNNNNSNNTDKRVIDSQFVPMNLITNTGLDLSHSIRKPTFTNYYNNESLTYHNNSYVSSPSSSTSASIDVENDDDDDHNDDSGDRIMSPVSIPSHHQQKPLLNDTRNPSQSAFTNMELTAGSIPSGFPLNYQQLYANNAALYGAPVMFSGAIHAAHASYMAGLPLHAALSPNENYLKAIQACGIYSHTALAPPPPPPPASSSASVNPSLISMKSSSLHNTTGSSMMALAPSSQPMGISKSPQQHHHQHQQQQQQHYSPNIASSGSIAEVEQQKKDYHVSPLNSQTALRLSASGSGNGNSSGTYLNDKVNERLTSVDATKDSHFKVPNGKEGSLKHRILRPPSNSECATEPNKTPVMRTYSTNSNFKKGNYIELSNGALRRVEDMRTEDFIQCAERSPHHQLAESTVVKINTSLPTTAVITFSYDRNRSKVDMEVSFDHPFFVYGQGWASCNPEMSMKMFGLKCQRLQVGDICISLTKREQPRQSTPPVAVPHTTQNSSLSQLNEALNYQRRHALAVSSPNAANLKSPSLPTMSATTEMPYAATMNAHAFSIPVPQPNHHLQQQQQQQHHHHQVQQQAYAEMAKLMSSYAYAKGLPQLPHEQLKEVVMDAALLQNLPPKMMSAFYQNQIFQLAQQQQQHQQQQEHLRQTELKHNQQRVTNAHYNMPTSLNSSHSPQPTDLENNHHSQQQPPQTQPLDVTMSRKRRWSAPENMFDDDESDTQPPRNGSSPATARS